MDDFDLFEYTESFNEFDDDLNQTLDDAELDAVTSELDEIDEQDVCIILINKKRISI